MREFHLVALYCWHLLRFTPLEMTNKPGTKTHKRKRRNLHHPVANAAKVWSRARANENVCGATLARKLCWALTRISNHLHDVLSPRTCTVNFLLHFFHVVFQSVAFVENHDNGNVTITEEFGYLLNVLGVETTPSDHINDPPNHVQILLAVFRVIQGMLCSCFLPLLDELLQLVLCFNSTRFKTYGIIDVHWTALRSRIPRLHPYDRLDEPFYNKYRQLHRFLDTVNAKTVYKARSEVSKKSYGCQCSLASNLEKKIRNHECRCSLISFVTERPTPVSASCLPKAALIRLDLPEPRSPRTTMRAPWSANLWLASCSANCLRQFPDGLGQKCFGDSSVPADPLLQLRVHVRNPLELPNLDSSGQNVPAKLEHAEGWFSSTLLRAIGSAEPWSVLSRKPTQYS